MSGRKVVRIDRLGQLMAADVVAVEVEAVARTLRWCSVLLAEVGGDEEAEPSGWAKAWREIAKQLGALAFDDVGRPEDGGCCVVCQEVVCDAGCPLEEVRR